MAAGNALFWFDALAVRSPGTSAATLDVVTGGSTPAEKVPVLDFDASATEYADFEFILPATYGGGGLTFELEFGMSTDTNTAHRVRWELAIRRIGSSEQFASAHTYDFNGASQAIPSAIDITTRATITFTNGADMDSLAVGERGILRMRRRHDHSDDDATGDAEFRSIYCRET